MSNILKIYFQEEWIKNVDAKLLITGIKNMNWKNTLPGGWLKYSPPRSVCGYGDGSYYTDEGKKYGKSYNKTSWSGSVPFTNTTAVTKPEPIPNEIIKSGILKTIRNLMRKNNVDVDDSSCTGIWCNYYTKPSDVISPHTDDEDYYEKNFRRQEPIFVSLTLYEDESSSLNNLSRFPIKKNNKFNQPIYHL